MIYVDELNKYPQGQFCHMYADSDDELHTFAASIGLRRSWAHLHKGATTILHYDLTPNKRALAIKKGAQEVRAQEYVGKLMREAGLLK